MLLISTDCDGRTSIWDMKLVIVQSSDWLDLLQLFPSFYVCGMYIGRGKIVIISKRILRPIGDSLSIVKQKLPKNIHFMWVLQLTEKIL